MIRVSTTPLWFLALFSVLAGCSSSDSSDRPASMSANAGAPSMGGGDGPTTPSPSAGGTAKGSSGDTASPPPATPNQGVGGDGQLTAGAWDDNRNFDLFQNYRATVAPHLPGSPTFSDQEFLDAHQSFAGDRPAKSTLDIALVVDTTGSMGDEITYLQSEFRAMHDAIGSKYPNAQQRWSLVAYRDEGDSYVVDSHPFSNDPNAFSATLQGMAAGGGGDYPEAPDQALAAAAQLDWRDDATAKLAFWVSDAPHHDDKAQAMTDAIRALRSHGVHMYPVASSGANDLTELDMRTGAQLTGGRFIFLTDDSGIGNAHTTPRVPCFFVTKLENAILRMVDVEITGVYREPDAADVIRTGGDPKSGRCTLQDGQEATAF